MGRHNYNLLFQINILTKTKAPPILLLPLGHDPKLCPWLQFLIVLEQNTRGVKLSQNQAAGNQTFIQFSSQDVPRKAYIT
jgi:hypothetical protein